MAGRNHRAKYCADCAKARRDEKMKEYNAKRRRTEHKCRKCGADISHLRHNAKYCEPCAKETLKTRRAESQRRMCEAKRKSYRIATSEFITPEPHKYRFMRVQGGWRGKPCAGGGISLDRMNELSY